MSIVSLLILNILLSVVGVLESLPGIGTQNKLGNDGQKRPQLSYLYLSIYLNRYSKHICSNDLDDNQNSLKCQGNDYLELPKIAADTYSIYCRLYSPLRAIKGYLLHAGNLARKYENE